MVDELQDKLILAEDRSWVIEDRKGIQELLDNSEDFSKRLDKLQKFYMKTVFSDEYVQFLSEDDVVHLLDGIELRAIESWNILLRWGAVRVNAGETLKAAFARFAPLINFLEMSADEISTYVMPYEHLLPRQTVRDLLTYHLKKQQPQTNPEPKLFMERQAEGDRSSCM
jgi:hypothetical protein